jgi:signal transduction histidine kinase
VRVPGLLAIYFACFFGFAVFVSLLAHALLAYERRVRWLATMGVLITLIYLLVLGLEGVNLLHFNVYIVEGVQIATYIMIFAFIAMCGQYGPMWLILQLIVFFAYVITMGASSSVFRAGSGDSAALFGEPWQQAVYYTYYSLSGIIRFGALVQCKNNRATSLLEELAYWVLIVIHMGMYFAVFALKPLVLERTAPALDSAQLINQMSNLVQFALTPLLLVHFEALSRARARTLILNVERANKQLAVAQSAAEARREFIRYVFHEVRVPFNTIVLGLDELKAAAIELGNKSMVADIKLMRTAADGMQQ